MSKHIGNTKNTSADTRATADSAALLQVHLAEYQAVTTRSTYWITLQYAFWPVLALFFSLAATVATSLPQAVFAWGVALGTQMLSQTYYFALYEVYNNARYIEHQLKPRVESVTGGKDLWLYESFLRNQRGSSPMFGEYFPVTLCIAATAIVSALRLQNWSLLDSLGLVAAVVASAAVGRQANNVVKARSDLKRAAQL